MSSPRQLQILINGKPCDEFTQIVHSSRAEKVGRSMVTHLKNNIPQQIYAVALQARAEGRILARDDVKALHKNVTQKIVSCRSFSTMIIDFPSAVSARTQKVVDFATLCLVN